MSKTPTQNNWYEQWKENFLVHISDWSYNSADEELEKMHKHLLADARKEVIDSIHDKFCEFAIQGGDDEQAQKGIMLYARTLQYLATLRKETK